MEHVIRVDERSVMNTRGNGKLCLICKNKLKNNMQVYFCSTECGKKGASITYMPYKAVKRS